MLRVKLALDASALNALRQAVADSPREFYNIVNRTLLPQAQRRLDRALNEAPGAVVRPFQFATDKSRRYYFATHKGGYRRTGAVLQWRIVLQAFSGRTVDITFENAAPYAKWVFGDAKGAHQVPGHRRTGWKNVGTVLPAETAAVLADLSEAWVEVVSKRMNAA